jgi:lipopolysaccharide export system permease protein
MSAPVISVVSRYITVQFLRRFLFILLGFIALVQLFDVLSNADDIVSKFGAGLGPLLRYILYRLPATAALAMPFAVLIGALLTLLALAQNNEIMALKSTGMSFYRVMLGFLPIGLLIALAHFVITDQLAPRSLRALALFEQANNQARPGGAQQVMSHAVWIRDRDMMIRADRVVRDGSLLWDVEIIRRDPRGIMTERRFAKRAQYAERKWLLSEVNVLKLQGESRDISTVDSQIRDTTLRPADIAIQSVPPSEFTTGDLRQLTASAGIGSRPISVYATWLQKRYSLPVVCLLMILLAAPVSAVTLRSGGTGLRMAIGVGLGFLYFVADGLATAMGETGSLAPVLAAWAPAVIFASIGGSVLLRVESV